MWNVNEPTVYFVKHCNTFKQEYLIKAIIFFLIKMVAQKSSVFLSLCPELDTGKYCLDSILPQTIILKITFSIVFF